MDVLLRKRCQRRDRRQRRQLQTLNAKPGAISVSCALPRASLFNLLLKIVASRLFAWTVLAIPGIVSIVIPACSRQLGLEPLKELFHRSGEIAIWTLGSVLILTPLKTLFPQSRLVSALNRHRRSVGVTAFVYVLFHLSFNFINEGGFQSYFASISDPFFVAGTIGFLILFLLTATSNDWVVRAIGFSRWKWIHRLVYLAAIVLFYHQGSSGRGNWGTAFALFIPVVSLEAARFGKPMIESTFSWITNWEKAPAWSGWRQFALEKRVTESATITSFYLRPEDGKPLLPYRPGQFLTIEVRIPGQADPVVRTYTLSDASNGAYLRLSVKREKGHPPGQVSNWLHDHFKPGDKLLAKAPAGQFCLEAKRNRPVVLISAGVGITPMIAMLNTLAAGRTTQPVYFLHGARNRSEHAFADHVRSLASLNKKIKVHIAYSQPSEQDLPHFDSRGRIGIKTIQALVPNPYADFYLCGPAAFMKEIYEDLANWGVERIHYESFGPSTVVLGNGSQPLSSFEKHEIYFYPNSQPVVWDGRSTLLDAALANGLNPRYGCRSGVCGTCACRLLKGKISYVQAPAVSAAKDTVLLCSARPDSDVVIDFSEPVETSGKTRLSKTPKVEVMTGIDYRCFRQQS
jgi:ferredoxin-NADP reductase/DMSO/TMAO reductase YedYZ heme-binding membrane subunit